MRHNVLNDKKESNTWVRVMSDKQKESSICLSTLEATSSWGVSMQTGDKQGDRENVKEIEKENHAGADWV